MSLSSPRIVTSSAGSATAEITSSRAGDTVYWALRSTAYTNTESIKTGAGGAVDFGNFASVSGVNSISASSIPLDTDMVFSFFAEPPTIAGADNTILYSNTFNNPAWTLTKTLLDSGQADPLGTTTGWRLKDDGVSATGNLYIEQQVTGLAAGTYTFSVHVKAESYTMAGLWLSNTGDASMDGITRYDMQNQTVVATTAPGQFNTKAVSSTNGFVRIATSFTTTTTENVRFRVALGSNSVLWITPDNTHSMLIYGAQVSAGAQLLTYSETTDAPVI